MKDPPNIYYVLFNFYVNKCLNKKNKFLEYELHDGGGTKNIYNFFKDKVILKESEWILVLDNDKAGQNLKRDITQHDLGTSKTCFIYYSENENFELEDLIPTSILKNTINETFIDLKIDIPEEIIINENKCFYGQLKELFTNNK